MVLSAPRASALDIAAAVVGGLFIGVSGFMAAGAAIWAVFTLLGLPVIVTGVGEVIALGGFVVLGALAIRNGLRLAAEEAANRA